MSPRHPRKNPGPGPLPAAEAPAPPGARETEPAPPGERLAYSVDEAARLTGLSRDLLYDEMRRGHLDYLKVGRRRLITRRTSSSSSASPPDPGRPRSATRPATCRRFAVPPDPGPQERPARDLALYEQLIRLGIAEADGRGSAIDHVTARRMALWLLPRSQEEAPFMRGLIRFARTGAVTHDLKRQLRLRARSPGHPNRPYAARLLQYAVARGTDLGPVGTDFAGICDQVDRADVMLIELREHVNDRSALPGPADPDTNGQQVIAMARHDPRSQTVGLILDAATANAAIHAISAQAADREAHTREIQQNSQHLPEDSYGRRNREAIAARETRIADRLRAVERAYRTALDPDATPAPDLIKMLPAADRISDRELELE